MRRQSWDNQGSGGLDFGVAHHQWEWRETQGFEIQSEGRIDNSWRLDIQVIEKDKFRMMVKFLMGTNQVQWHFDSLK